MKFTEKSRKLAFKTVFVLGLAGTVLFPVTLMFLIDEFWLTFYTYSAWLTAGALIICGLGFAYAVFLFAKYFFNLKRKPFGIKKLRGKYQVPAILMLAGVLTAFFVINGPTWPRYDLYPHLSFTSDPATSITVSWYTTGARQGRVDYGQSPSNLNLSERETAGVNQHEITLSGLDANTTYYYKIEGFGETWNFTTASNAAEEFSFIAISDVHNQFYQPMLPDILAEDVDFFLSTGDLVDYGGWNYQWQEYFNQIAPFATSHAVMSCVGNHDIFFNGINNYVEYLALPDDSGSERYYYFEYNGVHFICLDLEWGAESYSAAQKAWFEAKIAEVPNDDWLIVFNHCMHYSSGMYGTQQAMVDTFHDTFVSHDVDLVITGHDHHFEIASVDNITYVVIGNANSRLDHDSGAPNPCAINYDPGYSGYSKVTINGSECTFEGMLYENDVLHTTRNYTFNETW